MRQHHQAESRRGTGLGGARRRGIGRGGDVGQVEDKVEQKGGAHGGIGHGRDEVGQGGSGIGQGGGQTWQEKKTDLQQ